MPCNNRCCPPHNFFAVTDPAPTDCADSVVPGFETEGGYCTGSYWRNTVTGQIFIGVNDMACNTAEWMATNNLLVNLAHVRLQLGAWQSIPTGVSTKLDFLTLMWDANTDWGAGNHEFIAPRDGYYKVEVISRPATNALTTTTGWELNDAFYITGLINGILVDASGMGGVWTFQHATGTGQVFERIQLVSSATVLLTAADVFTVNMNHNATGAQAFHSTNTQLMIDELPSYGMLP